MTRYSRLRLEALEACKWRGHRMSRFKKLYNTRSKVVGYAVCLDEECYSQVTIDIHPLPNGIEIGGRAVACNCPARNEWRYKDEEDNLE